VILLLELANRADAGAAAESAPDAYVVHVGDAASRLARRVAEMLRDAGLSVAVNAGGGSFKSQMKRADASGARYALVLGEDEAAAERVGVKPLRASGEQQALAPEQIAAHLRPTH
jgi:histidyl-tRNA synthetase